MSSTETVGRRRSSQMMLQRALQIFAGILLVGLVLRLFVISSYVISGSSMLPTLWPGDFVVATRMGLGHVARGDVVALACPGQPETICARRVVGLPGDRVEWTGAALAINGDVAIYESVSDEIQMEKVPGQRRSWLIWAGSSAPQEPVTVVVPPGHVFLMSDRREAREDSRVWGAVDQQLIEARIWRVWLSLDWFEGDEVRSWPRVRWPRLGRRIH